MKKQGKYVVSLIGLVALLPIQGQAASITVDAAGNCTLAEAITSANNDDAAGNGCVDGSGEDTIFLQSDVVLEEGSGGRPPILSWITIEGQGYTIDGDDGIGAVLQVGLGPYDEGYSTAITNDYRLVLNNVTVTGGNHAHGDSVLPSNGGGITNAFCGHLILNNVTVSGNYTEGNGGGIFSNPLGYLELNNVTVSGNSAEGSGGGVYIDFLAPSRQVLLNSSIISGNSSGDKGNEIYIDNYGWGIVTMAFNVFGDNSENEEDAFFGDGFEFNNESDINATNNGTMGLVKPTPLSAILDPLADTDGYLLHALVDGSPAIDLDASCSTGLFEDQRGQARPVGAGCDAGSFEWILNNLPIANAGEDQSVVQGEVVCFDGSASFDPDNDPLSYSWELVTFPTGSTVELDNSSTVSPCFFADLPGTYQVSLVVRDGVEESEPDTVEIMAVSPSEAAIETLEEAVMFVSSLDATVFEKTNKKVVTGSQVDDTIEMVDKELYAKADKKPKSSKLNKQQALVNQLDATIDLIEEELYTEAVGKLQHSILGKTDGCVESGGEGPDKNDWINDCPSQEEVYDLVKDTIEVLKEEL